MAFPDTGPRKVQAFPDRDGTLLEKEWGKCLEKRQKRVKLYCQQVSLKMSISFCRNEKSRVEDRLREPKKRMRSYDEMTTWESLVIG